MLRSLAILTSLITLFFSAGSFAQEAVDKNALSQLTDAQKLSLEQALIGYSLFKKACFVDQVNKSRYAFLDSNFSRHEGEKRDLFLGFSKTQKGEVWSVPFKQGVYIVIVEDNQNCHVLAKEGNREAFHLHFNALYNESKDSLKGVTPVYYPVAQTETIILSGFEIKSAESQEPLAAISVSTPRDLSEDKPAAFMSFIVAESLTDK